MLGAAMGRWKKGPQIEMEDKLRALASPNESDAHRPILLVLVRPKTSGGKGNTESREEHTFTNAGAALSWLVQLRGGDQTNTGQTQQLEPEPEPEPEAASEPEPADLDPEAGYDAHDGGSQSDLQRTLSQLPPWTVHDGSCHSFVDELEGLGNLVEQLREQLDALVGIPSPSAKYDGGGDAVQPSGGDEQPLEMAKDMFLRSFHAQLISTLQRSYGRGSADGLNLRRHQLDAKELGEIMHWLSTQYAQTLLEYGFSADAQQAEAWVELLQEMHSVTPRIAAAYASYLRRILRRALQLEAPASEGPGTGWSEEGAAAEKQEANGTTLPDDIKQLLKTIIDDAAAASGSSPHILHIYKALAHTLASEVESISTGRAEVSSNATIAAGEFSPSQPAIHQQSFALLLRTRAECMCMCTATV